MAVRIRMKKMGRRHRPFFRICAVDGRAPRDGRVIEELGTYDPMVAETDARVTMKNDRVAYWLSVGAQPSDKVGVLIKKYGPEGTHVTANAEARARLSQPKALPELGEAADKELEESRRKSAAAPPQPAQSETTASEATAPVTAEEETPAPEAPSEEPTAQEPQASAEQPPAQEESQEEKSKA